MNDAEILKKKINELESLINVLSEKNSYSDKVNILNDLPIVQAYLSDSNPIQAFLKVLTPESEFAVKSIIAIGQAPVIFNIKHLDENNFKKLLILLEQLLDIEVFYYYLGGIIGYHYTMLTLIFNHIYHVSPPLEKTCFLQPEGLLLEEDNLEVRQAIRYGIENLQHVAVIYPLGGAGDRLDLRDEKSGEALPAALLPFLGRTLLEGMLIDLQAQEYLTYKLSGIQHRTPIAIMTSIEKNNHVHILNICKKAAWLGKHSSDFHFFIQPLAPVITAEGNWSLSSELTLTLKPSGHGVLWKLAEESGVFNWIESKGRRQCIVRQINNPLAATDQGMLALIGLGCAQNKSFGFLSCERLLNSDEGTNILIEKEVEKGYDYCLTNIEYTEFKLRGVGENPIKPGSPYSIYPTNTNILFANIDAVKKVLKICPIPGQLVNMKSKVPYLNPEGELSQVPGGRLESTMQNIADYIVSRFPNKLDKNDYKTALDSFILFNSRSKTISTTKKAYKKGDPYFATPEQAFYDLLSNNYSLLTQCEITLPPWKQIEEHIQSGPNCIFLFHPGLGPLYSIISQKIRKGHFSVGAELQLDIAEIDIEELSLEGSLIIQTPSPLGTYDASGILHYGNESRCSLRQVIIKNQGIDRSLDQKYWKNDIKRLEEVKIILGEKAEFHAEGIILKGSHTFDVPAHHRLSLLPRLKGGWIEELIPISQPTWRWKYDFDAKNAVRLTRY